MYENLVAFQKTYDCALSLIPLLNKFPKSQRFTLAQDIEEELLHVLRLLMRGVSCKGDERICAWSMAHESIAMLTVLLRLAHGLHFLSTRQYGEYSRRIDEIGKCISGLLSSSRTRIVHTNTTSTV